MKASEWQIRASIIVDDCWFYGVKFNFGHTGHVCEWPWPSISGVKWLFFPDGWTGEPLVVLRQEFYAEQLDGFAPHKALHPRIKRLIAKRTNRG